MSKTLVTKRLTLLSVFASLLVYADHASRQPFPGNARIKILVRTESGKPTGVRLRVTNAAGEYFAPLGHLPVPRPASRSAGDLILGDGEKSPFELHALVYDGAEIDLPPGDYTFHATKGFEYETIRTQARVT